MSKDDDKNNPDNLDNQNNKENITSKISPETKQELKEMADKLAKKSTVFEKNSGTKALDNKSLPIPNGEENKGRQ